MTVLALETNSVFVGKWTNFSILIKPSQFAIGSVELVLRFKDCFYAQSIFIYDSFVLDACYNYPKERLLTQHEDFGVVISALSFSDQNKRFAHQVLKRVSMQMDCAIGMLMLGGQAILYRHLDANYRGKSVKETQIVVVDMITGSKRKVIVPALVIPESVFVEDFLLLKARSKGNIKLFGLNIK